MTGRTPEGAKVKSHFAVRDRWSTRAVEWVQFALAWSFRWLTWPVGTWRLTGFVAPIGAAAMMAIPAVRARALENLARIWPEKPEEERHAIAKAAATQFLRLGIEYSRLDKVLGEVEIRAEGIEHLQAARAAGKGAILVSAHYGNWETARLAAKQAGCETGIIYRAFNNRYLDRFTLNLIPRAGAPVLQKGRQGMRQLVTHLNAGGFVMILVDQRNSGAPWIDFLDQPAETVTVAADLARRVGAALIPTRATRNVAARRFDVQFEAPVADATSLEMMEQVNARISAWVEEDPAQWFWFHRRWRQTMRSRPQPEPDPGESG